MHADKVKAVPEVGSMSLPDTFAVREIQHCLSLLRAAEREKSQRKGHNSRDNHTAKCRHSVAERECCRIWFSVVVVVFFFASSGSVLLLLQDLVKLAKDSMAKVQEYVDLINVNRSCVYVLAACTQQIVLCRSS